MRWLILPTLILIRAGLLVAAQVAARNWRRTAGWIITFAAGLLLYEIPALPAAETRTFPYEAVVTPKEGLYVRSGVGPKYYPTSKLKQGDRVLVHRHDPGGWYMIAPPPGSFSWIPAKYIQKLDETRGTVTANGVVARVGSFESDIREVFQRRLSTGDEVKILGEKMLAGDNGTPESWYRIEPPRSEWRWIKGAYVTAVVPGADPSAARPDPFAAQISQKPAASSKTHRVTLSIETPPETTPRKPANEEYDPRPAPSVGTGLSERPLIRKTAPTNKKKPRPGSVEYEREEIEGLDARLQSILDRPPLEWDFDEIANDYRTAREAMSRETFRELIDQRLKLIDQKQRVKTQNQEIERLGEETLRRDAELAALQREHEMRLLGVTRKPSQFDGAGIIQRSAGNVPNSPAYVLLAPNGRVLAYLQASGRTDLENWVGKSAGVYGTRAYREDLKSDLLVVNSVVPVRLAPQMP